MTGSGRLSLRARLLVLLICVTAAFLLIMGAVSAVVLNKRLAIQFNGDLAALPAEVVEQFDHPVFSRGKASASLSNFGAKRECGLGRRCQAPYRDLIEADRRGRNSVARGTEGWRGCANTPPFSSGKRVFIAEEILHRSPDPVLRVGLEL